MKKWKECWVKVLQLITPLSRTIRFSFQVCEHSCKCLKNVYCFVVLGLWSLKGFAQNTTIKVHRFEWMQNKLIWTCTSKYSNVQIPSINHLILLFWIWWALWSNMATNIIRLLGGKHVITLTMILNPKSNVVNP
jgi:hypothetical protein